MFFIIKSIQIKKRSEKRLFQIGSWLYDRDATILTQNTKKLKLQITFRNNKKAEPQQDINKINAEENP